LEGKGVKGTVKNPCGKGVHKPLTRCRKGGQGVSRAAARSSGSPWRSKRKPTKKKTSEGTLLARGDQILRYKLGRVFSRTIAKEGNPLGGEQEPPGENLRKPVQDFGGEVP